MNLRNRTIYIGDNLPRLKGIDSETVDLIYLDPPFNSRGEYQWPIGTEDTGSGVDIADGADLTDADLERLIDAAGQSTFKDAFTLDDLDVSLLQELLDNGEAGGEYTLANTQLLCSRCNRIKGNRDMDYLAERLAALQA